MIPIKDHNPTTRPSFVVPLFIAINVVMFLFVQPTFSPATGDAQLVEDLKFFACSASIPYEVTHGETVLEGVQDGRLGGDFARITAAIQQGGEEIGPGCRDKNIWLSILTSLFLHGGWLHIIGNMLFLWVFGNNIEDRLGHIGFVLFYVLSGVAATFAQSIISSGAPEPLIGASGAIAGVLGAYLLLYPRARVTTLIFFIFITSIELPAVIVLGLWFVIQVFQGVGATTAAGGGVAYMAHVGGFLAGMLLLLVFRPKARPPIPRGYD